MSMKVGFIGLGQMGSGMAKNLLAAGHELTVWNRSPDKTRDLVSAGAILAEHPAGAARGDVVMTMLADDAAVEAVVYGENGILASPAIHVSHSTISRALIERLTVDHEAHGRFVAAPVFGRPAAAAAAKLFVAAAGPDELVDRCLPLFEAIGQRISRFGTTPSAANLVKLGGNFLILSVVETFAEAMTLVEAGGVERRDFYDFITSTILDAPVVKTYGEILVEDRFYPAGFPAPLGMKDMNLVDAASTASRVPMPVLGVLRDHLRSVIASEGPEIDLSGIAVAVRRAAGR
jgi:3-hydroxyisobutyrate dehydrogenase-like beta-hydroxyacid dehydrogenase